MTDDNAAIDDLVGIWSWQLDTDLVIACERVCEYVNAPPEYGRHGITRERFEAAIHPDDRPSLARSVAAAMAGTGIISVDYRLRSIQHGTRWVRSHGRCFRNADGHLTHISGYLTDIAPSAQPVLERRRGDLEQELIERLTQAQNLAMSLEYDMLRSLIDATLLETGYQIAKRFRTEQM